MRFSDSHSCVASLFAAAALMPLVACAPDPMGHDDDRLELLASPARANSGQPHLSVGTGGGVVMSWLSVDDRGAALYTAQLSIDTWSQPREVARGANWFVNWADFPSAMPIDDDLWAAHWLVRRPGGTYSYDVAIALSEDGGRSWSEPITPHRDQTPTEHGFVSLFAHRGGVGAVWLDGRNSGPANHDHAGNEGSMTLRSAIVRPDGSLANEVLLDQRVCDCCQTDAVVGPAGPWVVYRDRSATEVRDIALVDTRDGVWRAPSALPADHWQINGCPVNGPAMATQGRSVMVAWYTGADDTPKIRLARSDDLGHSFHEPVEIDGASALGRVDVVAFEDTGVAVSWVRKTDEGAAVLMVRYVDPRGVAAKALALVPISPSRASGFPQMVVRGSDLVFAWTHVEGGASTVRTAVLDDAQNRLTTR